MTHEDFQNKLSEIPNLDLAEKAQSALSKLCRTGGNSFTMTVPPTLDDTDMIFSEVIKRFDQLSLPTFPDPTDQLKAEKKELLEALESVLELQKSNYGNGMKTHIEMIGKAQEIESLIQKHKQ